MKSRIAIMLSVALAVLVLVMGVVPNVMPTSPVVEASPDWDYRYAVPFTCGTATTDWNGVKPANYNTTINIFNPNCMQLENIIWKVVMVHPEVQVTGWYNMKIDYDGRCIKCNNICGKLGLGFPPPNYVTGYVVIFSAYAIDVCGVYTTETDRGVSIDTERIYYSNFYC